MADNEDNKIGWWEKINKRELARDAWLFIVTMFVVLAVIVGVNSNAQRIDDINQSRKDSIVQSCTETNDRHDDTIKKLDAAIAQIPPGTDEHKRALASRKFTVGLIDSLAPKQDCQARADDLVEETSP